MGERMALPHVSKAHDQRFRHLGHLLFLAG